MNIQEILKKNNIREYILKSGGKEMHVFHNERINQFEIKDSPILGKRRDPKDVAFLNDANNFGVKLCETLKSKL